MYVYIEIEIVCVIVMLSSFILFRPLKDLSAEQHNNYTITKKICIETIFYLVFYSVIIECDHKV